MPGAVVPWNPAYPVRSAALERVVSSGVETINADVASMQLPFESQLKRYVKADDTSVSSLITNMKTLLSDLKNLTFTFANTLLNPITYNVAYTSTLFTNLKNAITTNLADTGTGLPTAAETAMYNRRRDRRRFESSRTSRRITEDISKRLPYAGILADKLTEADQDNINAMDEVENWITEQQALMTYKFQRDKVAEAMDVEKLSITEKHERLAQHLQAMIKDDENLILQTWNNYELQVKRALGHVEIGIDFALKAASGPDQITFENWLKMSKILGDAQLDIVASVANLLPSAQDV